MKNLAIRWFGGVLWAGLILFLPVGCYVYPVGGVEADVIYEDVHHPHRVHEYYYYPSAEVYYDPRSVNYYWHEGGHWHSGRHLPRGVVIHNENRIAFRSDARRPYNVHERVIERYHAPRRGETYERERIEDRRERR